MRKIYLVRHGQTNANVERKYCGQTDVDLNHKGLRDAGTVAKVMKNISLDSIISSDLKRTIKTAEMINEYHNLDIELLCEFREINFGKFENLTFEEIGEKYPEEKEKMIKEKVNYNFLNGESLTQLHQRVIQAFNKLLKEKPDDDLLIVSHGGVIRMILTEILSGDIKNYWSIEVDNTTITTIIENDGFLYLKILTEKYCDTMQKIVLAGTSSNVGKTTITIGLLKALTMKGLEVNAFKSGPDYIDPMFHQFVTKNQSINLDLYLMGKTGVKYAFGRHSTGDISIIEGVMGLFDGVSRDGKEVSSTALLAKTIDAPVILIIDGSGVSTSAAAQVIGYDKFDDELNIVGVLVNKVHGERHYRLIKEPIEKFTGIKCLGYLSKNDEIALESQHLGLIPSDEVDELSNKIEVLGKAITDTVDLDALLKVSKKSHDRYDINYYKKNKTKKYRLGIAKDKAFSFYYQDNLDYFEDNGIELVEFSPLESFDLPENIDGIYFGGGFPEKFVDELFCNKSLIKSIKEFADNGGMIYGECGGLIYLSKSIVNFNGKKYPMAGILDLEIEMTNRLQHFGYIEVEFESIRFKAHEFHRSKVIQNKNEPVYRINKFSDPGKNWSGGYRYKNVLAGYPHVHFYSNFEFANFLMNKIRKSKEV